MGYVVFRDHTGWFGIATAEWWERPSNQFMGERLDTRVEIDRFPTKAEADDLRVVMNMMMHKRPHRWAKHEWSKEDDV